MKWIIYKRGTIYPYRSDMYLKGVFHFSEKFNGNFVETFYLNLGKTLWWTWNEGQIHKVGNRLIKLTKNRKLFSKHIFKLNDVCQAAISASEKIRRMNLKSLTNQELLEQYDFLNKFTFPANGFLGVDIDAFDILFEDFFIKEIKNELKDKKLLEDFNDIYKILSKPLYQSYSTRQEQEILKLAMKDKNSLQEIDKLYEKFWWTKLGWENDLCHHKGYFTKEVNKFRKDKKTRDRLFEISSHLKENKKERKLIIKKYKISKKTQYLLNIIDEYNILHEKRKEQQVKDMHAYYLLLSEVARRLKLSKNDLVWLWQEEIKNLLLGEKLDNIKISLRKKAVGIWVKKDTMEYYQGDKANQLYSKYFSSKIDKDIKTVKGLGVNKKIVSGKVKVCAGAKEAIKNVKKGDILICPMTLPDYLPAMKRAVAVVTDEGGLTCHAAIICRELQIPCIVGTKISTKVFKNGDLIEVNANHGIVKLLKRA